MSVSFSPSRRPRDRATVEPPTLPPPPQTGGEFASVAGMGSHDEMTSGGGGGSGGGLTPDDSGLNHSGKESSNNTHTYQSGGINGEHERLAASTDSADSFNNLPPPSSKASAAGDLADDDLLSNKSGRSSRHGRTLSGGSQASFSQSMILDQMELGRDFYGGAGGGDDDSDRSDEELEALMEEQDPHHTQAAYPYLNWELLSLEKSKYLRLYKDRTVEVEYVRYAFYSSGRSPILLVLLAGFLVFLIIIAPDLQFTTPIDITAIILLCVAATLTFLQQRRKDQLKSYEEVCRNCARQEKLAVFIWVILALLSFASGPKISTLTSGEFCDTLCTNSMRVISPVAVYGLVGLRLTPRLPFVLPLVLLNYVLFLAGFLLAIDPLVIHKHGETLQMIGAVIFLAILSISYVIDKNRRSEFEKATEVYTLHSKWLQQKKQYSAFLSEMMPATALNRILRNQHVADVTMEASVAHCELYDFSTWAQKQQNPQLVLTFMNTFAGALDIRASGTGLEKVEARGDAYTAICGVSAPSENHAARVCTFILTLHRLTSDCVRRSGVHPVQVRCGGHTGPLMGLVIGDRMRYDVFGRALSLTRTLTQAALPGGCCVSYPTQNLVTTNSNNYFKVTATKTKIPLAGVASKQAVAYTLSSSDAWDPDSLVLPPETVVEEVNFTESIRSTFLASTVTRKGNYEPPSALDLKSFAAYTRRRGDKAGGSTMEEEFSALHRVLKSKQSRRCVGKYISVFPNDVEAAYTASVTSKEQVIPRVLGCFIITFLFFGSILGSVLIEGNYTFITMWCAIAPLGLSGLGLPLYKKRVASPVLDAVLIWGPWLLGTLLLAASDIELHPALRDPAVFRAMSAVHHVAIPRRFSIRQFIVLDLLVNTATNLVVVIAYYQAKLAAAPLIFSICLISFLTVVCNGLLLSSIYTQKQQALHRCIFEKISRATELEVAVYVALTKVAFPTFCAEDVMDWYLHGKLPERTISHYFGPQVVWFANVSVKTVSLEDPSIAASKLNAFQNELEGLLYRAKCLLRFSTNGDTVCLSGPIHTTHAQAIQGRDLIPLPYDNPPALEADLDKTINLSVSLAYNLNEYGKTNGMTCTMVGHLCSDVSAAALGNRRLAYNLIGPDVDLTRRVLYAIPENQVHATPSIAQRFDRMNSQRSRNPMEVQQASVSQVLEDYASKLIFGPVKRHTVQTDGKGTITVDTNALQLL